MDDRSGQDSPSLVEFALIVALIIVIVIGAAILLGPRLNPWVAPLNPNL